jgi:hypothetical protein
MDHTPPECLLPEPLPPKLNLMTMPACAACNGGFSKDEVFVAAVVSTVSFTEADRVSVAPGGRIWSAMNHDRSLKEFVESRMDANGNFHPDAEVMRMIHRVAAKTAAGVLFHEFGRVVPIGQVSLVDVNHAKNIHPSALAELNRRDDGLWAEVTPSGRELERHAFAFHGEEPPHMPKWRTYVRGYFRYMFVRRSNHKILVAMNLHEALIMLVEAPWPSRRGPHRDGQPLYAKPKGSHRVRVAEEQ